MPISLTISDDRAPDEEQRLIEKMNKKYGKTLLEEQKLENISVNEKRMSQYPFVDLTNRIGVMATTSSGFREPKEGYWTQPEVKELK